MKQFTLGACLCIFILSCQDKGSDKTNNKFSNVDLVKIYELSDKRNGKDIIPYLKSSSVVLREAATLSFASIRDTSFIRNVENMLSDSDFVVRIAAAYATGQMGLVKSLNTLKTAFDKEQDETARGEILEAIGKIVGLSYSQNKTDALVLSQIRFLDSIRFDTHGDRRGWSKAAFWIHQAGITDERLMNRMPFVLQKTDGDSRIACANAMVRFKGNWFEDQKNKKYVLTWCRTERNSDVRIAQMTMLGRINNLDSKNLLMGYLKDVSQDQLVRIAAVRAAGKMQKIKTKELLELLKDQDDYIVLECLAAMMNKNTTAQNDEILTICNSRDAVIRSSAMKLSAMNNSGKMGEQIWSAYKASTSIYDKVHYARALGASTEKANECHAEILIEKQFPLKYALTESYIEMHHQKNKPTDTNYLTHLIEIFNQDDIGTKALVAIELREVKLSKEEKKSALENIRPALASLVIPREIETYNEIVKTINAISPETLAEKKVDFNHPIDWTLVASIPHDQKVKVTTTKGEFILDLKVNDAPGSVSSFITLAKSGFYNNKYFHRVIPNFVIQGGCPRGDGMGGTDYTLRSEFGLHSYSPGAVGLASSGSDTESCQWFVAHTHTPHLEGRYSIFAYVNGGMEVVKKILVGDQILKVEIL